ncbi:MAG: SRPBCC domain-containing protein [Steroidobacteraceae bacterium]
MSRSRRGYALKVEIRAAPGRVWTALSQQAEFLRWWMEPAELDLRADGSLRAQLDAQHEIDMLVDIFDPPKRLRLIHLPSTAVPAFEGVVVDDLLLETAPQGTIFRILGSGFPAEKGFERSYLRLRRSWERNMARLKVYLEKVSKESP